MANDLNQCNFIGRLGADPETRYLANGTATCNFRIAVGWKTTSKQGVEWVPIVAFGKLAEICSEYLKKGTQIYVSGRLCMRQFDGKDGTRRYTTEIVADKMQMLSSKQSYDDSKQNQNDDVTSSKQHQKDDSKQQKDDIGHGFHDMEDDIPF